jgi:L-ribulose-5-phosphate 3-epimerase
VGVAADESQDGCSPVNDDIDGISSNRKRQTMKICVMAPLENGPEETLRAVHALGLPTCQVVCWNQALFTEDNAARLKAASQEYGVEITTVWAGQPGRHVWDFIDGPSTIGLTPPVTRAARVAAIKAGSDFAAWLGVPSVTTHVGFIPENPGDPLYAGLIEALREIALYCRDRGQTFWFETGQETPITLLRAIEDIGTGNLGVNLDPANLLLYGKANPVDALDILGPYVRGVHAKDGEYPTNGRALGEEKPLGQGRVNFPRLLARLHDFGYDGALTIEREISGPQQIADIKEGTRLLTGWLAAL